VGKLRRAAIASDCASLGKNCRSGKFCRESWANTSTFQKSSARKIQQIRGKNWFTTKQGSVNNGYYGAPSEPMDAVKNRKGGAKAPPRAQHKRSAMK